MEVSQNLMALQEKLNPAGAWDLGTDAPSLRAAPINTALIGSPCGFQLKCKSELVIDEKAGPGSALTAL